MRGKPKTAALLEQLHVSRGPDIAVIPDRVAADEKVLNPVGVEQL